MILVTLRKKCMLVLLFMSLFFTKPVEAIQWRLVAASIITTLTAVRLLNLAVKMNKVPMLPNVNKQIADIRKQQLSEYEKDLYPLSHSLNNIFFK